MHNSCSLFQASVSYSQNTKEKGVPNGKAFETRENLERKLESRMRKLNFANDSSGSAKLAKQLEALLTPRSDRKVRRGKYHLANFTKEFEFV